MDTSLDFDLVDVLSINSRIRVDIPYATANDFISKPVYSAAKCFLRRKVVLKLDAIQQQLEKIDLGLKLWDGYRPLSVQKFFWNSCLIHAMSLHQKKDLNIIEEQQSI